MGDLRSQGTMRAQQQATGGQRHGEEGWEK